MQSKGSMHSSLNVYTSRGVLTKCGSTVYLLYLTHVRIKERSG
jgi:hypothetical protein